MKKPPMGSTCAYVPLVALIERSQMRPYHIPKRTNFLSEWVRFGTKSKLTRKGVYLAYIPFRGNELGAKIGAYHEK